MRMRTNDNRKKWGMPTSVCHLGESRIGFGGDLVKRMAGKTSDLSSLL